MEFFFRSWERWLIGRIDNEAERNNEWTFTRERIGTTYTIALTPRQYRSHIERNLGWPPKSQLSHVSNTTRELVLASLSTTTARTGDTSRGCSAASWMAKHDSPFEGNTTLGDSLHIEAECGYGAFRVVSNSILGSLLFRISARSRGLVAHTRS